MKTSTKLILAGTATIVAAGVIFGIVQISSAFNQLAAPVSHSTAIAPTPSGTATKAAAAPIVGDLNGDGELDGWEKDQLARSTYTMPDGSKVAIPANQPIPAPVVAAIQSNVAAAAGKSTAGSAEVTGAHANASVAAVAAESAKIGRTIVPVFFAYDGLAKDFRWAVGAAAAGSFKASTSEAAAVAAANAWIGDRASTYIVVEFYQK